MPIVSCYLLSDRAFEYPDRHSVCIPYLYVWYTFLQTSNIFIRSLIIFQEEDKSMKCLIVLFPSHSRYFFCIMSEYRNILLRASFLRILQYKSGPILHLGQETEFFAHREKISILVPRINIRVGKTEGYEMRTINICGIFHSPAFWSNLILIYYCRFKISTPFYF